MQANPHRAVGEAAAPEPWDETLGGVLPFLLIGLAMLLEDAPVNAGWQPVVSQWGRIFFLGGYGVILIVLRAGWLEGVPRWVFPSLLYGVVFALYFSAVATPGLAIFNVPMWGRGLWGWRAWVPLGCIALVALLFSRPPWGPLVGLVRHVQADWRWLALFYAAPWWFHVSGVFDSTYGGRLPTMLVVLLGAFLYLRGRDARAGFIALMLCAFIAMLVMGIGCQYYWETHAMDFQTGERLLREGPLSYGRVLGLPLLWSATLSLLLLSPGLIRVARRWKL